MPDPFEIITKVNMWYQCIIKFPNRKEFVDHLNTLHKKRKEMLSVICVENYSYMNINIIIIINAVRKNCKTLSSGETNIVCKLGYSNKAWYLNLYIPWWVDCYGPRGDMAVFSHLVSFSCIFR